MADIEFSYSGNNEYEIKYKGKVAGIFRLYENPDFSYAGIKLIRFLGYIWLEPEFRRLGILCSVVREFNIKSLMVDDIDNIPVKTLIDIYNRLGFRLIEGSERFMIRD